MTRPRLPAATRNTQADNSGCVLRPGYEYMQYVQQALAASELEAPSTRAGGIFRGDPRIIGRRHEVESRFGSARHPTAHVFRRSRIVREGQSRARGLRKDAEKKNWRRRPGRGQREDVAGRGTGRRAGWRTWTAAGGEAPCWQAGQRRRDRDRCALFFFFSRKRMEGEACLGVFGRDPRERY